MTRLAVLLGALALGCFGGADDDGGEEPAPMGTAGAAGAAVRNTSATECTSLDEQRACVQCNGEPDGRKVIELDGNLVWVPPADVWHLISQQGELETWCRE